MFYDIPSHNIYASGSRRAKLCTCAHAFFPPQSNWRHLRPQASAGSPGDSSVGSVQLLRNKFNYSGSFATPGRLRETVLLVSQNDTTEWKQRGADRWGV